MSWASADRRGTPRERTACAGLRRECASASSAFRGSPCGVQFAVFLVCFSFVQLSLMFVNTYSVSLFGEFFSFNPPIPAAACLRERAKQRRMRHWSLRQPLALRSRVSRGCVSLERGRRTRARGAGTCAVWGCEHISYYYTHVPTHVTTTNVEHIHPKPTWVEQGSNGRKQTGRANQTPRRAPPAVTGLYTPPSPLRKVGGLTPPSSQTRS